MPHYWTAYGLSIKHSVDHQSRGLNHFFVGTSEILVCWYTVMLQVFTLPGCQIHKAVITSVFDSLLFRLVDLYTILELFFLFWRQLHGFWLLSQSSLRSLPTYVNELLYNSTLTWTPNIVENDIFLQMVSFIYLSKSEILFSSHVHDSWPLGEQGDFRITCSRCS